MICLEGRRLGYRGSPSSKNAKTIAPASSVRSGEGCRNAGRGCRKTGQDAGIIRHRGKIQAIIGNARRTCKWNRTANRLPTLSGRLKSSATGDTSHNVERNPHLYATSDALSKALKKRGFKFVGTKSVTPLCRHVGW